MLSDSLRCLWNFVPLTHSRNQRFYSADDALFWTCPDNPQQTNTVHKTHSRLLITAVNVAVWSQRNDHWLYRQVVKTGGKAVCLLNEVRLYVLCNGWLLFVLYIFFLFVQARHVAFRGRVFLILGWWLMTCEKKWNLLRLLRSSLSSQCLKAVQNSLHYMMVLKRSYNFRLFAARFGGSHHLHHQGNHLYQVSF